MKYDHEKEDEYDVTAMVAKPLYFGMFVNVMLPAGLLFVCYYINNRTHPTNHIPDLANSLFYVFAAIGLVQAGLAIWWRNQRFERPMVKREESIEHDIQTELMRRSKPVFLQIAAISVWGYVYFFLTGRFPESVVFVVFSFLVFQLVRPRYGSVRKLIKYQTELVERGELMGGGLAEIRREVEGE